MIPYRIRVEKHPNLAGLAYVDDARTFRYVGSVEKAPGTKRSSRPEWIASSIMLQNIWVGGTTRKNARRFPTRKAAADHVFACYDSEFARRLRSESEG